METFGSTEDETESESEVAGRRMYQAVTAGDVDEVGRILAGGKRTRKGVRNRWS